MKTTRRRAIQLMGCSVPALLGKGLLGQASETNPVAVLAAPVNKDNIHFPMRKLRPDEVAFFNSDHSPVGAHVSLVYGMEASGGLTMLDVRRAHGRPLMVQDGIVVAVKDGPSTKAQVMPFCPRIADPLLAEFVERSNVHRVLRASTDAWNMGHGVSWVHCTPYWPLHDIDHAPQEDVARFLLPATWMTFEVDNRNGTAVKSFLFSLLDPSPSAQHTWGDHHGFIVSKKVEMSPHEGEINVLNTTHAVAVPAKIGKLLSADQVRQKFGIEGAQTAIEVDVPRGERREFTVVLAHYNDQPLVNLGQAKLYLTKFYSSIDPVVQTAIHAYPAARRQSETYQAEVKSWGLNDYRQFLYGHALASYMFNTRLFLQQDGQFLWSIIEGEYDYINTFDLVVDQVFLELAMHPWTVRNELDLYATKFHYVDKIRNPEIEPPSVYDGGLGFNHDMGGGFDYKTPEETALPYPLMSQEELQNWIISAGLYWKKTNDTVWLNSKRAVLEQCLASMLIRDDIDPAKRDGITTYTTTATAPPKAAKGGEITTYDSLDLSLRVPQNSSYIATKSFASYLALEAMFVLLGDTSRATISKAQAGLVAKTVSAHFDHTSKSFPARFNGEFDARVIPTVEGLAYPYLMGLKEAVSPDGPYAEFIQLMRIHMDSILQPGICMDATSGAWKMSSSTLNTWESKIYLAQFVTEKVLGLSDERTRGEVDEVHYAIQVLGNPVTGWTDQILSDIGFTRGGSRHYPRGVTAYLWSIQ
jgi:hypothetical protein